MVRLVRPESGQVVIGNQEIYNLPEAITGRRLAYAGSDAYMFQGTMRDNLLYGLKHAPLKEHVYSGEEAKQRQWEVKESEAVDNPSLDVNSDWIDYQALRVKSNEELLPVIIKALDIVALSHDVFELGLRSSMGPEHHPKLSSQIRKVRASLRARLETEELTEIVVPFEPDAFNAEATVGENLIFGSPMGDELKEEKLKTNPYVRSVLKSTGLDETLYHMGREIASNVIEILGELPPDHPFFQQLMFMSADELPEYRALMQRVKDKPFAGVSAADVTKLLGLSLSYSEPRYRFGVLDAVIMKKVVDARKMFHANLPEDLKGSIETYDPDRYNSAASLLDNALFGRIAHRQAEGAGKIRTIVRDVLEELELYGDVIGAGLLFNVGAGGRRITVAQRQKLNLARALLKGADYIFLNKPLSTVDIRTQEKVMRSVLELTNGEEDKPAVIWVLSSPHMAQFFDRVIVFEKGRPVEDGQYDVLLAGKSSFAAMLTR
jgi:putative ABC transport system ATP-binding protein